MAMALPSGFVANFKREFAGTIVNIVKSFIKNTLGKNHLAKQREGFTKFVNLHKREWTTPYREIAKLLNSAFGLDALEDGLVVGHGNSVRMSYFKSDEKMLQDLVLICIVCGNGRQRTSMLMRQCMPLIMLSSWNTSCMVLKASQYPPSRPLPKWPTL